MPGDSTDNQLTFLYNSFCQALDNGLEVLLIFFDRSKTFEKVLHRGLLHKLEFAGIIGNVLKWLSDYLNVTLFLGQCQIFLKLLLVFHKALFLDTLFSCLHQ